MQLLLVTFDLTQTVGGDSRYAQADATLGFNDPANLDDGAMWPTAFALTTLTAADEQRIADLVTRAAN